MTVAEAAAGPLLAPLEPPPPQKMSRYRSLRGKSVSSRFSLFRDGDAQDSLSAPRIRSSSVTGFRKSSTCILSLAPLPADVPSTPAPVPSAKPTNDSSPSLLEKPLPSPSAKSLSEAASGQAKSDVEAGNLAAQSNLDIEEAPTKKPEDIGPKEEEEAARYADEVARLEAETGHILAEQRKLDHQRAQAQLSAPPKPKQKRLLLHRLTLFSRTKKWSSTSSQPPGTPSTIAPTIFTPNLSPASSIVGSPPPERMSFIDMGPKSDAPLSAINGGERRVTVRCVSSAISLEVTADTTPIDILKMAASMTRHDIDMDTSIVIECYFVLGLERRLRKYEHIRDVMNSWDRDQENSILIMSCDALNDNKDLDISSVPRTDDPLSGFTIQLYHSSRPGKWNKRFVTLLGTGQMFASKRSDSQVSDKDSTCLCHLSDFDIYKPKESETRRHLKPPKKLCYAIRSQQKTVVFPNGENFVHFFCTDDSRLAARFFELVHSWRSWYLVNKQVNLRAKEKAPQLNFEPESPKPSMSDKDSLQLAASGVSTGSFMDDNDFAKAIEESTKKLALEARRNKLLAERKASAASVAPTAKNEREFAVDGLLGDTYDKRKELEATAEANGTRHEKVKGPFTNGPSLLNSIGAPPATPEQSESRSWFPSATEHTARARTQSISVRRPMMAGAGPQPGREKGPQPLLNFASNFSEPPHSRDGPRPGPASGTGPRQGHGLRPPPGSPLINFATGGPGGGRPGPLLGNGPLPSPGNRGRRRSTAGPHTARRFPLAEDLPPIQPMAHRGPGCRPNRMPPHDAAPRDRDPRHPGRPQGRSQEPLVNHAR